MYRRLWLRLTGHTLRYEESAPRVKLHISVWRRIVRASQDYAPRFITPGATLVGSYNSTAYAMPALPHLPVLPNETTRRIEKLVLARQVAYLVMVFASLLGLVLGFLAMPDESRTVSWIEDFLPSITHSLARNAVTYPNYAIPIIVVAGMGGIASLILGKRIANLAFRTWQRVIDDFSTRCPKTFRQLLQMPEDINNA